MIAKSHRSVKEATAYLRSTDKQVQVLIKLRKDGEVILDIIKDGKTFHRELSPSVDYND